MVHAGSWDATYTAFNASGLEDGRREVFTWRHGGPQRRAIALPWANPRAAQGQLRMPQWWFGVWTLQPQAASSALEVRPSVKLKALLPYGGLPLWCAKPQPRCDFAPPKVYTAALIPDDLRRARLRGITSRHTDCNPTYLTLTRTYRFRGMVSTLLNAWRNARVVSGTVGPAQPTRMLLPLSALSVLARLFAGDKL